MTPAVVVSEAVRTVRKPNPISDRVFFSAMTLLILVSVLYGFARTYFLAGMVAAPLPNRLIHFHGAAFTLWIVLLIVQTALISARRVRVHMTLGMGGFGLAVAMVGLGVFAAADALRRGFVPVGMGAMAFLVFPVSSLILVRGFIFFSFSVHVRPHGR